MLGLPQNKVNGVGMKPTPSPGEARARIEVGEGYPKTDALQQQVTLADRYRAIRPLALRRTPEQFGRNPIAAQNQDFLNAQDARVSPDISPGLGLVAGGQNLDQQNRVG